MFKINIKKILNHDQMLRTNNKTLCSVVKEQQAACVALPNFSVSPLSN